MSKSVIDREEMLTATLKLGGRPIELADYATTGLTSIAIGPKGYGKTNAGLLMAEQLSVQGWVSVLIDPEDELSLMYGAPVKTPEELYELLCQRTTPIIVVSAHSAAEFVPFGRAILKAADELRKPLFVMIDEGQLFSSTKKRKDEIGESADIINDFAVRGRKRALDIFVTAHRYAGSIHRSLFNTKNLTLVGCQEDPTVWATLAPQFRASKLEYKDLNALIPGEFYCFSRRGVDKIKMPMADALKKVARKAVAPRPTLPTTFSQWTRAMENIPTERLLALTDHVRNLLGTVAGLPVSQTLTGQRALDDELEMRK